MPGSGGLKEMCWITPNTRQGWRYKVKLAFDSSPRRPSEAEEHTRARLSDIEYQLTTGNRNCTNKQGVFKQTACYRSAVRYDSTAKERILSYVQQGVLKLKTRPLLKIHAMANGHQYKYVLKKCASSMVASWTGMQTSRSFYIYRFRGINVKNIVKCLNKWARLVRFDLSRYEITLYNLGTPCIFRLSNK